MKAIYKAQLPNDSIITGDVEVENGSLITVIEAIKTQNPEAHMIHYHIEGDECDCGI